MGEITPHHIQQLQQLLPQMHTQTQQQNQYMWPPQAPQNPEPPQINLSGGKHNKQTFFVLWSNGILLPKNVLVIEKHF